MRRDPPSATLCPAASSSPCPATKQATLPPGQLGPPAQSRSPRATQRPRQLAVRRALRATSDRAGLYTFWDYQAGAWQKNNGIRIDHALLSPEAASRLVSVGIDAHVRGWERPSDHVPMIVELAA